MPITPAAISHGLAFNSSRVIFDKANLVNQTAGLFVSSWRSTGQPGQGAIPTTVAVCDNTLTGGIQFSQQTAPFSSFIAYLEYTSSNSAMTFELHDRLVHVGGLAGNNAAPQTITGLGDLDTLLATSNLAARVGDPNYSDVQWWLEWYTDTGSTVATIVANVTYNDDTTGDLTAISLAATRRVGNLYGLNSSIPAASAGKYIKGVNTVDLSVSTGTLGNFGVTATRPRVAVSSPLANFKASADWANLPISEVPNSSCLFGVLLTSTTSMGTIRGGGKIIHLDPT